MRVKRQKINRRTIRFYKTCSGFREPFKVLCDGTFLHYLLSHKMNFPAEHLSRLLFGQVRPFTTRCVIAELKRLGQGFSETLALAQKLDAAKCDHHPLKSASDCLENLIQDGNQEHFWISTQDADFRVKLRQMAAAVPIILAQTNFLVLEPPSEKQHAFARNAEAQRTHATEREFNIIEARERKKEAILVVNAAENAGEEKSGHQFNPSLLRSNIDSREKSKPARRKQNGNSIVDRPQYKRNRAKGPNPLSFKKKKTQAKR